MLKITNEELQDLINTELTGDGLNPDVEYDDDLQKALSAVIDYSYITHCLPSIFPHLDEDDLWEIRGAVEEGIKEYFEEY